MWGLGSQNDSLNVANRRSVSRRKRLKPGRQQEIFVPTFLLDTATTTSERVPAIGTLASKGSVRRKKGASEKLCLQESSTSDVVKP